MDEKDSYILVDPKLSEVHLGGILQLARAVGRDESLIPKINYNLFIMKLSFCYQYAVL